jgi:hypothetical protein
VSACQKQNVNLMSEPRLEHIAACDIDTLMSILLSLSRFINEWLINEIVVFDSIFHLCTSINFKKKWALTVPRSTLLRLTSCCSFFFYCSPLCVTLTAHLLGKEIRLRGLQVVIAQQVLSLIVNTHGMAMKFVPTSNKTVD